MNKEQTLNALYKLRNKYDALTYAEPERVSLPNAELTDALNVAIGCVKRCNEYELFLTRCVKAIEICLDKAKSNNDILGESWFYMELKKYKDIIRDYENIMEGGNDN